MEIWQISHANLRILVRIFGRLLNLGAAMAAELVGQVQCTPLKKEVKFSTINGVPDVQP